MDDQALKWSASSKGRWLRLLGTLASSALFVWLLARQDWRTTYKHLMSIPLWLGLVVFLLYFSGMVLNAWRWSTLLRTQGLRLPFLEVLKIMLSGAFASNFLPSTIGGDSVRVVSLLRYEATLTVSMATVVMDRLLNVLAMFTLLPFSLTVFPIQFSLNIFPNFFSRFLLPSILISTLSSAIGWLKEQQARVLRWFEHMVEILRVWVNCPKTLLLLFIISWLSSFVIFLAVWMLARALGIRVTLIQVIGVMTITYLVSMLPISVNGYGVREVTLTTLYVQIGASLEQASTLAVITRFMLLLEALPGALWLSDILQSIRPRGSAL